MASARAVPQDKKRIETQVFKKVPRTVYDVVPDTDVRYEDQPPVIVLELTQQEAETLLLVSRRIGGSSLGRRGDIDSIATALGNAEVKFPSPSDSSTGPVWGKVPDPDVQEDRTGVIYFHNRAITSFADRRKAYAAAAAAAKAEAARMAAALDAKTRMMAATGSYDPGGCAKTQADDGYRQVYRGIKSIW